MNEKILFVDDDRSILAANRRLLRGHYEVITAHSGKQGIVEIKKNGPIAVIVSDFRMPEMDGVQFLSTARQITPDTVRILLTGQADMQATIDAINEGNIFRFLKKPCENQMLKKTIEIALEQYRHHKQFIQKPQEKPIDSEKLKNILAKGENNFVEFKSSLRWDYKTKQVNKTLEYAVAKTISAFLNSEGGKLLIGVSDEGEILGLEKDKATLTKKQSNDGFQQKLVNVINRCLGKEFHQFIHINIEEMGDAEVCIVEILESNAPAFLVIDDKEKFFIRASTTTQPMNLKEAIEYINSKWGKTV
jgi:FixJ family two-component response regulator